MKAGILALTLCVPLAAQGDVEMRFDDGSFWLVSNGDVLFGDARESVLVEPGSESMVVIDHEQRTWTHVPPDFAERMQEQITAQMEAMLADVPPEQRAMYEQQMQGMMPQLGEMPSLIVRRTGETDEVAGFDCEIARITTEDGGVEDNVCIASPDELGIRDADFQAMADAMKNVAAIMSLNPDAIPEMDFGTIGGVPIRSMSAGLAEASKLVGIDTDAVEATRVEIPPAYREVSVESMMTGN